jgi:hypothetical protein
MAYRIRNVLNGLLSANHRVRYEIACRQAVQWWDRVVDPYTRMHTSAVRLKEGKLLVHADNPVLANELIMQEEELRSRLNRRLGWEVVKRVMFTSGRVERKPEKKPGESPGRRLSAGETQRIERTVQAVGDSELRDSLRKLLKTIAGRTRGQTK